MVAATREFHGELTIVLAMDFSRDAKAAAKFLLRLRLPRKCRTILLHVEEAGETLLDRLSRLDTELPLPLKRQSAGGSDTPVSCWIG